MSEEVTAVPPTSIRAALRAALPEGAIKQHPTKTYMSSVNSMYVIERLNDVFGEDGWEAVYRVIEASVNQAMVVVECILTCRPVDLGVIRRQTFGGNDNKDRGDAYKGACTDALTKAASQIGIAQDVYKGMHDRELEGDEQGGKGRKPKKIKDKYEIIEGIVTEFKMLSPSTLWLKANGNAIRAVDAVYIDKLKNCMGKRIEINARWDSVGKNKTPCMTVTGVHGVYELVDQSVQSKCFKHGAYAGDGECPSCQREQEGPF